MNDHERGCLLTATDYQALRRLLERMEGSASPLAPLLREKLAAATVVEPGEIAPRVATINSRVEYQVGTAAPELRILVGTEFRNGLVGLTLPVSTPYGLALLGLRQGDEAYVDLGGQTRRVLLRRVAYQPEAARARCAPALRTAVAQPARIIDLARVREQRASEFREMSR